MSKPIKDGAILFQTLDKAIEAVERTEMSAERKAYILEELRSHRAHLEIEITKKDLKERAKIAIRIAILAKWLSDNLPWPPFG